MVLITAYDTKGNECDNLGGFFVADTVEGRLVAKKIIKENDGVQYCKLDVYEKGYGSRLLATSTVFNTRR